MGQLPELVGSGTKDTWTWSSTDKSPQIKLKNRAKKVLFHPKWSNGTSAVRGTRVLNQGRHYWEVRASSRIFGTSIMFGIGTKKARLHATTFTNLIGEDCQSWGLSHKGLLWHGGQWKIYTKPFKENEPTTIGLLFDWNQGTLTYYKDGENLGVAFTGLNECSEFLFPIVASTAARTVMSLHRSVRDFYSLQDRCRAVLLNYLENQEDSAGLPLPRSLIEFLNEGMR